ncbi:MAG: hypothetical protein MPI95_08275 [Nitrosopumilus sp.]|nr:hypothetical protein [Nitrosopumilus sp.]CAI9832717.1 hypothetical protein IBTHAUMO2_950020 [Nitrosopumilaceae archaeon]MDA7940702.1 hypothetical protein [Nitrosopumilus sp.]MDA7942910.1 hypothetical protein [Nitrosopumilus sp.]MDA7944679.1 hypothetical protein [Nitrosopumilus sp.]
MEGLVDEMIRGTRFLEAAAVGRGDGVDEMISMYHVSISVSSILATIEQGPGSMSSEAGSARRALERFDGKVHPEIMGRLDGAISRERGLLESGGGGSYDRLRALMSAREFAGQYGRNLQD